MKTYKIRQLFDFPVVTLKDVKPYWSGNLNWEDSLGLLYSSITELPDNFTVGGYLDLRNSQITKLPNNLTVEGDLYLQGTQITELPDGLEVGCVIYVDKEQIEYIPEHLKNKTHKA